MRACRLGGKRRKYEHLMDLPESIATFLISFALDGQGLYVDDLLQPASELMRNPTIWWTNLGKDDKERTKSFDVLSQARMDWAAFARTALGRALEMYEPTNSIQKELNCFLQRKSVWFKRRQTVPPLSRK
ncbi:unnamed protein product [Cylicocyclus nassatus]|uniref:Uncharacterized protein n=1 Tax=Cylicocyclus nassatus TaxID=53992 RepID=A0AA36M3L4_CYLNA|nr:unnamed protein product [Cylicocyclus nassatus]